MPEIFKYFWFICAAVMTINLVIWRRRLATVVARGIATQAEVDTFLRGVTAWLVGRISGASRSSAGKPAFI